MAGWWWWEGDGGEEGEATRSSPKMEDLLPHTTADMVAPAPTAASQRRRRSVRGRQSRYSPPPAPDTIWPSGVRPVRPSSRGDPRRDGAPEVSVSGDWLAAAALVRRWGRGIAWLVGFVFGGDGLIPVRACLGSLGSRHSFMDVAMLRIWCGFSQVSLPSFWAFWMLQWNVYAGALIKGNDNLIWSKYCGMCLIFL